MKKVNLQRGEQLTEREKKFTDDRNLGEDFGSNPDNNTHHDRAADEESKSPANAHEKIKPELLARMRESINIFLERRKLKPLNDMLQIG